MRERRVYVWVNDGEEGVRVGQRGREGCACGSTRERRVCVWVNEGEEGVRVGEWGGGRVYMYTYG